jgi:hypothetical protein
VKATDVVKTDFMGILGITKIDVGVESQVKWGNMRLRVALALDNTPSMDDDGKLDALKTATKNLLDQLKNAAGKNGDVYVSIVPFNTDVNVGVANVNASWISWDNWDKPNGAKCTGDNANPDAGTKAICETGVCSLAGINSQALCTSSGTCSLSGYSTKNDCTSHSACSKSQYTSKNRCENHNGKWQSGTWTSGTWTQGTWQVDHSKWSGCVQDRDKSPTAYNVSNTTPSGTTALFPADPSDNRYPNKTYCAGSVMPQTYDWSALQDKVKNMSTSLKTNTTIGLVHGWQTLTDGAPYDPPAIDTTAEIKTQKVIIFLTDGQNTQDRWDSSKNVDNIDDRMKAACANAKTDNITVFTILVLEGNEDLLKSCASPDDALPKGPKYFKLTSADQLVTTFQQIGTQLSNLRIAQ